MKKLFVLLVFLLVTAVAFSGVPVRGKTLKKNVEKISLNDTKYTNVTIEVITYDYGKKDGVTIIIRDQEKGKKLKKVFIKDAHLYIFDETWEIAEVFRGEVIMHYGSIFKDGRFGVINTNGLNT